ncbi:MAG: LysR family transcriptional regulator [Pseudomonadota bacterium]
MNWDDYRLILALLREKTVRGAARVLGVSHATVSRRLAHLNGRPEGPFIQKSPSGLWPTKSGEVVFDAAKKMELLADEAARRRRTAGQRLAGPLCISIPNPVLKYLLFDAIVAFTKEYPEINLTVDATDQLVNLDKAEADIVVRSADAPPEHWVGRRLFPYVLSFYGHRDYVEQTPEDAYRWIAPPEGTTRWPEWLADSPYPNASAAMRVTGITGRFNALLNGVGIARAACFMADSEPTLVRLPNAPLFAAEPFWVLGHPDFAKSDRGRLAIRFFAKALQQKQPLIQGGS